ncbi:uncharacterized protein BDV17DRAFT_22293 [Aspergillus undulatus]|uniref:uncharacterized protein n=1 Tax=Aspergillus undulatus TaxID=1810928 RepID=UPI003CCCB0FF
MCPMLVSSLRDGPTMILSPPQDHSFLQLPHQSKLESSSAGSRSPFASNGFSSGVNSLGGPVSSGLAASKPSRKRSRDDVTEDTPIDRVPKVSIPAPEPEEEPIYGEGMTLLNPRTGMALSAESQTGTWYEEEIDKAMAVKKAAASQAQASAQASRKSQRLDPSAPSLDDIASSRIQQQLQENDSDDNRRILNASSSSSNPFSPQEPLVDDATRLLGISWQRVQADDADMAAAIRGWKKYIDRQFSQYLADAEILMKNRALNIYLVSARPMIPFAGLAQMPVFYLFNDDLTQGQLVASSWETCLRNLQSSPVVFEGTQVLNASDKPPSPGPHHQNVLSTNPAGSGRPLLQTMTALPVCGGVGMNGPGSGMDIDM